MRATACSLIVGFLLFGLAPARAHVGAAHETRPGAESIPLRPPSPQLMEDLKRSPHAIQEWTVREEERAGRPTEVWYQDGRERLHIDRR